jgi:hypothetical protein
MYSMRIFRRKALLGAGKRDFDAELNAWGVGEK